MIYFHRTLIVPATIVEQVRALASNFPATEGMWTRGVCPIDSQTVTHYISAGMVGEDMIPLLESPEELSLVSGLSVEEAEELLNSCIISPDDPYTVLEENNLQLDQTPETAEGEINNESI